MIAVVKLYMILKDGIIGVTGPRIPDYLKDSLEVLTTCEMKNNESKAIGKGILQVACQLQSEAIDVRKILKVAVIISPYGEFTLSTKEHTQGELFNLISYPIFKWRELDYTDLMILTIVLEELCHHYWTIRDETEVKYKVAQIINRWNKTNLTASDLYDMDKLILKW